MTNKKISRKLSSPIILFDEGGPLDSEGYQKFAAFINSDEFKAFSNGIGALNSARNNGQGAFLAANRGKASSNGLMGAIGSAIDTSGEALTLIDSLLTKKRKPIEKTIGLYGDGGHLFANGGGGIGAMGYMNMGTTALALAGNAIQNAQIEDTTNVEESIQNARVKQQKKDDSFDALTKDYATLANLKHISWRDLRNRSDFGDFTNSLSASAQGFSAGSSAGPWGAAIGGVVGGASSLVGSLIGRSKAKKQAEKINKSIDEVNDFNKRSLSNRLTNLRDNQSFDLMSNFAAYGGPLDFGFMPVGGAIDYELAQKRLQIMEDRNKDKGISPVYAFGGALSGNGADWTNGIVVVGNGGTHEQNPFEGVQMGVASDGTPNLVEEGEVVWKDYVFSKRIKVPDKIKEKYKLKGEDLTFADAAQFMQKSSAERPNDPIAKRTLDVNLGGLMSEQEAIRQKREARKAKYAHGGFMGHHFDGLGPDSNFMASSGSWPWPWEDTTGQAAPQKTNEQIWEENHPGVPMPTPTRTPIPVIGTRSVTREVSPGITETTQEPYRAGWTTAEAYRGANGSKTNNSKFNPVTALRYVPALGAGIGVFSDLMGWTNKPDYTNADMIMAAANAASAGLGPDITYKPIGDYLRYTPLDRLFYANQLASQAASTRRNLLNTSGGNRGAAMAGILAADFNAQSQLGNLFRQAEEYNLAQRHKVAEFNRATNEFNTEADLKAKIANKDKSAKQASIMLEGAIKAAALRDATEARASAAKSANLTNLFDSLGNIGIDAYNRQDRDMLIKAGVFGTLSQKPQEWSQKRWEDYQKAVSGEGYRNEGYRNGGILKKRKGITI